MNTTIAARHIKRNECLLGGQMKIEPFCNYHEQLAKVGNHKWSVARLIELSKDLPVMEIPLDHLNTYTKYENMTLRKMVGHMLSVRAADINYPIILDEDGEIMDGRHRIMKALLENKKTIKAVRFEENPPPCSVEED